MKYSGYAVVMQEIPDEISLALEITNCPHHCKNCHSPYLRENIGTELTEEEIDRLITKNPKVTCILFMGGDKSHKEIARIADYIHNKYNYSYLVGMYSGDDLIDGELISHLDYYKVGSYCEERGPLTNPLTNQHLYQILVGNIQDITYKFWRKQA